MKTGKPGIICSAIFTLFFLTISCNETPPEIIQIYSQGNFLYDPGQRTITPIISLFIHVEDEDGIDDIDRIYIIRDDEELFWELDPESWSEIEQDGVVWIGTSGISYPPSLSGISGTFRIIVIDAAGERTEIEEYIGFPGNVKEPDFPLLEINGRDSIRISGRFTEHILWLYNEFGALAASWKSSERSIQLNGLIPDQRKIDNLDNCYIYAYSNELGAGLLSGPFPFE